MRALLVLVLTAAAIGSTAIVQSRTAHAQGEPPGDELVVPLHDARNLAAGGGWMVWAAPDGHAWRLVVRTPTGATSRPAIRAFGAAPRASVGRIATAPDRWVAVFARCAAASATRACDLYRYDLAARTETKLTRLSTREGSERAPSLQNGTYAFVRDGGPLPGTFTATSRRLTRIDRRVAASTAVDGVGHVAYVSGGTVYASSVGGHDRTAVAEVASPFGLFLTPGVRAGWLQPGSGAAGIVALRTARLFRGYSAGALTIGARALPASTNSAVVGRDSQLEYYLDETGIHRLRAPLFNP